MSRNHRILPNSFRSVENGAIKQQGRQCHQPFDRKRVRKRSERFGNEGGEEGGEGEGGKEFETNLLDLGLSEGRDESSLDDEGQVGESMMEGCMVNVGGGWEGKEDGEEREKEERGQLERFLPFTSLHPTSANPAAPATTVSTTP